MEQLPYSTLVPGEVAPCHVIGRIYFVYRLQKYFRYKILLLYFVSLIGIRVFQILNFTTMWHLLTESLFTKFYIHNFRIIHSHTETSQIIRPEKGHASCSCAACWRERDMATRSAGWQRKSRTTQTGTRNAAHVWAVNMGENDGHSS